MAEEFVALLRESRVDFTSGFRALSAAARGSVEPLRGLSLDLDAVDAWLRRWVALGPSPDLLDATNPVYIPRNHLVEEALDAATAGDLEPVKRLVEAVRRPFEERPGLELYAVPAPEDFGRYTTYCGT